MRYILQEEKKGRKMSKRPVIYKDSTIIEEDNKSYEQKPTDE